MNQKNDAHHSMPGAPELGTDKAASLMGTSIEVTGVAYSATRVEIAALAAGPAKSGGFGVADSPRGEAVLKQPPLRLPNR